MDPVDSAQRAGGSLTTEEANAAKPRTFKFELSLWGIKIGPIELPAPRFRLGQVALLALALTAVSPIVAYVLFLRQPLTLAHEAIRMARYDLALEKLQAAPDWLSMWPGLAPLLESTKLANSTYKQQQDWEQIGAELRRQRKARPNDMLLQVLEAEGLLGVVDPDYERASQLVDAVVNTEPDYAQAWFLRGLIAEQARGDRREALENYQRAVKTAPDSPQYQGNLARTLLDLGRYDEALTTYSRTRQLPLAQVEAALAWWSKGNFRLAGDAQRSALVMMSRAELMNSPYNRVSWTFVLANGRGRRLSSLDDKRCYASLGEAASRRLDGDASSAFPPATCAKPPQDIADIVAEDLCRFVEAPQPAMAASAAALRTALRTQSTCTTMARVAGATPANR